MSPSALLFRCCKKKTDEYRVPREIFEANAQNWMIFDSSVLDLKTLHNVLNLLHKKSPKWDLNATFVKYDKKWFTMVKSCLQNGLKLFRIGRNCNIQFLAASPLLHHFMSQVFSVISSLHFIIFSSISPLLYPFSFMAKRFIAGSFLNNMILIINKLHRLF